MVEWIAEQNLAALGAPPSPPADVSAFVALLAQSVEAITTASRTRTLAQYVRWTRTSH